MNTTILLYLWLSGIATVMLSRHGLVAADCTSGSAQCRRMRACHCGKSSIPVSCIRICVRVTAPGKRAYERPVREEPHPFVSFEEDSFHDTSINRKTSNSLNAFLPYHPVPVKSTQCVLDKLFLSYPPLVQAKIIEVFREAEKTLQDMRDILDLEINFSNDVPPL